MKPYGGGCLRSAFLVAPVFILLIHEFVLFTIHFKNERVFVCYSILQLIIFYLISESVVV